MEVDILLEKLMASDCLIWAQTMRLKTKSGDCYSLANHAYQANLLQREKRITNIKKGTQLGLTLMYQLMAIHGLVYKIYSQGVLYMMPSEKLVERFSKLRFTPMFEENQWLKRYLLVNNVNEKIINGGSLIFVGARAQKVGGTSVKDSDALRTFECDCVIRDEIDRHDMDMVEQSKQRLNYSLIRQEVNLGSPTYPDYGIDALYEQSDQSLWQIKCPSCGKYTCLETDWESAIVLKDGVWIRSCTHCGCELDPNKGEWVAAFPDREECGRWVSGFLSPRADLRVYMKRLLESEGNKRCEALRSIVGMASIEAENQLSEITVLSRCTKDPNQMVSTGETVMGVDIGKQIHVVTGIRTSREAYDILNVSRLNDLTELHDLALKMNVRGCVIDSGPYDHGVREFQRTEPYKIYLCQYSEQMPGRPVFDKSGIVKCNRNEWCDKVHITFTENRIQIPRPSAEISEYAHEMTRTAKTVIENPDTGLLKPRWIKLGADHYFHSTLYFLLAASRTSPRPRGKHKVNRPEHSINNWR
jgi:hypothetical protein